MMNFQGIRLASGSAVFVTALLGACGKSPQPEAEIVPPPPAVVDLSVTPVSAWDSIMVASAHAIAAGDRAAAKQLRNRLMSFETETGTGNPNSGHDALPGPSRPVRLYLLGELAQIAGDTRGLQSAIDSLLAPSLVGGSLPRKPSSYALALQALVLKNEGQFERAMERMNQVVEGIPPEQYPVLWVGGSTERPRRLVWLRAAGKELLADSLLTTLSDFSADRAVRRP